MQIRTAFTCVAGILALLVAAPTSSAAKKTVGSFTVEVNSARYAKYGLVGQRVKSIKLAGGAIARGRPYATCEKQFCGHIPRSKNRLKRTRLYRSPLKFTGVPWVISSGHGFTIKIKPRSSRRVGVYVKMQPPDAYNKRFTIGSVGCISRKLKMIRCPAGAKLPKVNHVSPSPPPPPPVVTGLKTWEKNLLNNGSFEGGTSSWTGNPNGTGSVGAVALSDPGQARDGSRFIRINSIDGVNPSLHQDMSTPIVTGDLVTFSIWLRVDPGNPVSTQVTLCLFPNVDGSKGVCNSNVALTTSWQKVTVVLNSSIDASTLRAQLFFPQATNIDADTAIVTRSLLRAPNFEYNSTGWALTHPPRGGVTNVARYDDATRAYDGIGFFEANDENNGGSVFQDASVLMNSGDTVRLSAWLRAPIGTVPVLMCVWNMNSNANSCVNAVATGQWQRFSTSLTALGGSTQLRVQFYIDGRGNVDFDAIELGDPLR